MLIILNMSAGRNCNRKFGQLEGMLEKENWGKNLNHNKEILL
jgi:hypothetical protein